MTLHLWGFMFLSLKRSPTSSSHQGKLTILEKMRTKEALGYCQTIPHSCQTVRLLFFLMLESAFKNSFQFQLSGGNRRQKERILLFVKLSGKQQHIAGHCLSTPYFSRFICSHITAVRLKQFFNRLVFPKKSQSQLFSHSVSSLSKSSAGNALLCLQTAFLLINLLRRWLSSEHDARGAG